jgi:hypothetical protein
MGIGSSSQETAGLPSLPLIGNLFLVNPKIRSSFHAGREPGQRLLDAARRSRSREPPSRPSLPPKITCTFFHPRCQGRDRTRDYRTRPRLGDEGGGRCFWTQPCLRNRGCVSREGSWEQRPFFSPQKWGLVASLGILAPHSSPTVSAGRRVGWVVQDGRK